MSAVLLSIGARTLYPLPPTSGPEVVLLPGVLASRIVIGIPITVIKLENVTL